MEPPLPESYKSEPKGLPGLLSPIVISHQALQCFFRYDPLFSIPITFCLWNDPLLKSVLPVKAKMSLLKGKPAQVPSLTAAQSQAPALWQDIQGSSFTSHIC